MEIKPATAHPFTATTSTDVGHGPVQRLLESIAAGRGMPAGLFEPDAVFDATVPNWRYTTFGETAVRAELAKWYAQPTDVAGVRRRTFESGEAVEVDLNWIEDGVPHSAHQLHVLQLTGTRIASDTVFCGGRWPAALLAEMEAAGER